MHAELARSGVHCGPELVRYLMRELDLVACQRRPWHAGLTQADGREHHIPDLLEQDFTADAPGTTLIGDITYIPTWQGWLYLATVIDVHTRIIIGFAMDDNYRNPLISAALRNAANNQCLQPNAVFHSDRGSNYTSVEFARTITEVGMRQSMDRTGIWYDRDPQLAGDLAGRRAAHAVLTLARWVGVWRSPTRWPVPPWSWSSGRNGLFRSGQGSARSFVRTFGSVCWSGGSRSVRPRAWLISRPGTASR